MRWQTYLAASFVGLFVAVCGMTFAPTSIWAATPDPATLNSVAPVDLFAAISAEQLDVKFIPKNDREARLLLTNRTRGPLSVRLPDAFAAVPVLAQFGPMRPGGAGAQQQPNQAMGAAGAPMGLPQGRVNGFQRMMLGNGIFNIPAEQVVEFRLNTVCLEHGKKDPRPAIPYQVRPLSEVTTKPGIRELLKSLGEEKIDQRAAQAAAWHLANGLSWEELAAKRIEHLGRFSEPYFSFAQLIAARQAADVATASATAENRNSSAVKVENRR
jgi:hypothetical protein